MSRYRKISVRMYADERFRRLTPPAPCGQALWIYLLTGPHTTNIPGLFSAGELGLTEALNWPLKGFREAFAEVYGEGLLQVDWTARVIFIPKALNHNEPESPNVVIGWRETWDEIPACALKVTAYQHFKAYCEGKSEAFAKAFAKGCRQPSPNQEQEQEQEQEKGLTAAPAAPLVPASPSHDEGDAQRFVDWWNVKADVVLARCRELTTKRRAKVVMRLKEHPERRFWDLVMSKINASKFLRGKIKGKPWRVSFDFLIENDTNAVMIAEGKYDDTTEATSADIHQRLAVGGDRG